MKFSQQAKLLGNGVVVIDFGSRIGNIRNSYQAGENWGKEMFIESSSVGWFEGRNPTYSRNCNNVGVPVVPPINRAAPNIAISLFSIFYYKY